MLAFRVTTIAALLVIHGAETRAADATRPRVASSGPARIRARVVATAVSQLGKRFPGDCSTFVSWVFARAHVRLPVDATARRSGSETLYRSLAHVRKPSAGDIVVFHGTYDRERPGPGRNLFTHVGIVESVEGPRVTFIHRIGRRVERSRMNLAHPRDPAQNDFLRRRKKGDPPGQHYLAGELAAGFASATGSPARHARTPEVRGGTRGFASQRVRTYTLGPQRPVAKH